jgi:ABC-type branched-subunit amino acid transport system substrate-binding protein
VDGDVWAALAHDAVMIIAEAATRQNSTAREAIRNGIAGMNDRESAYQGITGTTYFDVEGDTVKNVFFGTIKGGKFVPAPVQLPE